MHGTKTYGSNVVIISALIGILLANALDDESQKLTASALMIVGFTLFTMAYACKTLDVVKPVGAGLDKCYAPNPYYQEGFYK